MQHAFKNEDKVSKEIIDDLDLTDECPIKLNVSQKGELVDCHDEEKEALQHVFDEILDSIALLEEQNLEVIHEIIYDEL